MEFKDIKVKIKEEDGYKGLYEISPLPRGYGHTLANSLRRILLGSLGGGAVTQVKIDGVEHEYTAMDGLKEDVLEILLNIKGLKFKIESDEPQVCKVEAKGEKIVKGEDVKTVGGVEVMNKDAVIAHLTDKAAKLDIEMTVEKGIGYREVEEDNRNEKGVFKLDADFTPVVNVTYDVLQARKGQQMNLDSVVFTLETDGSITPQAALLKSSEILQDFAGKVMAALGVPVDEVAERAESSRVIDTLEDPEEVEDELDAWKIEDLQISKRTKTGLISGGYKTIGDLRNATRQSLLTLPGFGNKSFNEIYEVLKQYNIEVKNE